MLEFDHGQNESGGAAVCRLRRPETTRSCMLTMSSHEWVSLYVVLRSGARAGRSHTGRAAGLILPIRKGPSREFGYDVWRCFILFRRSTNAIEIEILAPGCFRCRRNTCLYHAGRPCGRSEEHTSELQSRGHLVCRLLLEKIDDTR